jgi:hypothetical protein
MVAVTEPAALAKPEVLEAAIVGARIVDPEIIDGKIVGGRIIGGRVIDANELRPRTRHGLHLDEQHRHTEIVAVLGLGMALLLMYLV